MNNSGIRFPKIHIAESVRQRILATFEEMGGRVPGVDDWLPGSIPQPRDPRVPSVGVGQDVALGAAMAPTAAMGGQGVEADPVAMQAAGQSLLTGGNLVDSLGG